MAEADTQKADSPKEAPAPVPASAERQQQQPVQVQVLDDQAVAHYANFCRVTGSPKN